MNIQREAISDNSIDSFLTITPKKPQIGFLPKEESYIFQHSDGVRGTEWRTNWVETASASNFLNGENGPSSPTDYIGAFTYDIPCVVDSDFTEFKIIKASEENFNKTSPLVPNDLETETVSFFNGVQMLKIPRDFFKREEKDDEGNIINTYYDHGKYYIKIAPKYIESEVVEVLEGERFQWKAVKDAEGSRRRDQINVNRDPFLETLWNFESPTGSIGRLNGSLVEVWDSTKTILKQQKFIGENSITTGPSNVVELVLYPDLIAYDAPNQQVATGDFLRVYPRETYFHPIFIELNFEKSSTINDLVSFMLNEATRNTTNGILEIYDQDGVVVESDGTLSGKVIQSYQISQTGVTEVKKIVKR